MLDDQEPFTKFEPGQLITAEAMNAMQGKMRAEIASQITEALAALVEIDKSKDSDALDGLTAEDLLQKFLEQAMQQFPSHTGYRKLFKVLELNERNMIAHDLKLCPLVDLYELMAFPVLCANDDDTNVRPVRFFLHHTNESRQQYKGSVIVDSELERGDPHYRMPLAGLLDYLGVAYNDETSLGDLETELWKAMFAPPNDPFDNSDYCHSPWFERCCREERTVGSLKSKGDWNDLWCKFKPIKTVNPPADRISDDGNTESVRHPRGVQVDHHDFDQLSLTLKEEIVSPIGTGNDAGEPQPLHLMVLLKV
ncbi:hypothetical protein [Yoonia sediminilitoris]|uniref:Uncharacterized protein n=1 Tax=Yoonia sediminilitoris TaxID=1286148 RepID=A0A2T6KBY9_9RHOB|nr:hypothetical protein [Yoonia sediminilitoris]PUB12424.1 hypothetical protein C8N45_11063 [Yoonia sediminilitoris]RCW93118.1 hypothetical protein DFP92_11063 [Yoonia sediminilitoris]